MWDEFHNDLIQFFIYHGDLWVGLGLGEKPGPDTQPDTRTEKTGLGRVRVLRYYFIG